MEAERRVRGQRKIVEELERDGHDTELARELLVEFERSLDLHHQEYSRIRAELG